MQVYRGYVDDPRNTDNAWMETVAFNFHDEAGDGLGATKFKAGTCISAAHTTFDYQRRSNQIRYNHVVLLARRRREWRTLDQVEWRSEGLRIAHRLSQTGREEAQCPLVVERTHASMSLLAAALAPSSMLETRLLIECLHSSLLSLRIIETNYMYSM